MSRKQTKGEKGFEANVIEIKAVTWNKDSHGLFDYESKNCINHKFKFRASDFSILRNKQNSDIVAYSTDDVREQELSEDYSLLTRIYSKKHNGEVSYFVGNAEKPLHIKDSEQMHTEESLTNEVAREDAYLIVRSLKDSEGQNRGHALEIGEKIKLGRVEYSVIEMKINEKKEVSEGSSYSFLKNQSRLQQIDVELEKDAACKICMENFTDNTNFLFSPCKCSGTCKYIHLDCLRNWIISKVKKEVVGGTAYYHFDKFQCELCTHLLPKFIIKNGTQHQLLSIDRPEGNYLILEEVGEHKKDLIVIKNVPNEGINLGRGHQCQIRINDISVSRHHATIILKDNKFVIHDKTSKFGTLVKLTRNLPIDNTKRAFQIGRTVLTFMMKKEKIDSKELSSAYPMQIELERRASK